MFLSRVIKFILRFSLPIGFAFIIIMMTSTSFFTLLGMEKTSKTIIESSDAQNYHEDLLKTMYSVIYERALVVSEMLITDDPFINDELFLKLNELSTQFVVARTNFKNHEKLDPKMQKIFNAQGDIIKFNSAQTLLVYEEVRKGNIDRAKELYLNVTLPRQKINLDIIEQMVDLQFWLEQDKMALAEESLVKNRTIIFSLNGIILLASIFISFFLIHKQYKNNRKLQIEATTDALTGLPNRIKLIADMDRLIQQGPKHTFAVLFFDIDFFKSINDNYGHSVGDLILQNFAIRVKEQIQSNDILSRFGGDEFVLLLNSIKSEDDARDFVTKLSTHLNTSFKYKDEEIFITASIGVSLYSNTCDCVGDYITSKSLLKQSDIAMYAAKESGRNCFRFFSKEHSEKLASDYAISHSLNTLLKDGEFADELSLVYQPLVKINDNKITECEALIRWKTPDGKEVSPCDFIPLAEKSYLIEKINHFVIDAACKQQFEWQQNGATDMRININLSGNRLVFRSTLQHFEENMRKYSLQAIHFGIELTERTLFEISDETISTLDVLRKQGMKISIDDFGTEYSSLSYLKKLPITTLKIDKSFISGLPDDKDDQALVKSIIIIAHSLSLDVVAEGVETIEQLEFLQNNSCNIAQGYYFHKPLNSKLIPKLKLDLAA